MDQRTCFFNPQTAVRWTHTQAIDEHVCLECDCVVVVVLWCRVLVLCGDVLALQFGVVVGACRWRARG